jgi:hypothetical protein
MATTITDNTDLIEYDVLTRSDIRHLTDSDSRYDNWARRHETAWTKVLDHLYRSSNIEEDDLDYPSQLILATCYYVAYLAYRTSRMEEDQANAQKFYELFKNEISDVRLYVNGSIRPPDPIQRVGRVVIG